MEPIEHEEGQGQHTELGPAANEESLISSFLEKIENQYGDDVAFNLFELWEDVGNVPELSEIASISNSIDQLKQLEVFICHKAAEEGTDFVVALQQIMMLRPRVGWKPKPE